MLELFGWRQRKEGPGWQPRRDAAKLGDQLADFLLFTDAFTVWRICNEAAVVALRFDFDGRHGLEDNFLAEPSTFRCSCGNLDRFRIDIAAGDI
ncbi:hypothetical protein D3C77_660240 [compost metagenome]